MLKYLIFDNKSELEDYYNDVKEEIKLVSIMNDTILDKRKYVLWFTQNIENSELVQ